MYSDKLADEIKIFSGGRLKRKDDLKILITADEQSGSSLLNKLSFTAKYVLGLKRVLEKGGIGTEITNIDLIKKDYSENIQKSISLLKEILNNCPEKDRDYFNKTYLELSREAFQNLLQLLEDLEWMKKYLNFQKHHS